ncbi:2Fe-2S iron-sulfur cluster-binding protein [Acidithiobacillus sp. IBUN Pt1247-S3]|uniref:2Fe-2S iron-sulfur cluster-binding protein n=1 Tax=Acidithiobacillus sp. IBUN Pt1247-S3 TaxID=3166642 RepID=UPI0034E38424
MAEVFYLDGEAIPFTPGQNVLEAVLAHQQESSIPYFCFHPALGSLGACRQCGVKVYPHDGKHPPRLVMACLLPASRDLQLVRAEADVRHEHQLISELLMRNHPHDCPICDEGGQCHLQNMTVASGHAYREYEPSKRTYQSQQLGPLIRQEMNRCITCYRCVRFYQDLAGGEDFGVFGSRDRVFFGRMEDGPLESPLAGNLAEVCPTGVFTDKVYHQDYLRPWDLEETKGVCPHCSLGCNTEPGAARGRLRRIRQRTHPEINPHFLCDRGRYGFRYVAASNRPRQAHAEGRPQDIDAVLDRLAARLAEGRTVFLGSAREDLDSNLALFALARVCDAPFAAFFEPWEEAKAREILALPRPPAPARIPEYAQILVIGAVERVAPTLPLFLREAQRRGAAISLLRSLPSPLTELACEDQLLPPADLLDAAWDWLGRRHHRPFLLLIDTESVGPELLHLLRREISSWPDGSGILPVYRQANLPGASFYAVDGNATRLRAALNDGHYDHILALGQDPQEMDGTWWRSCGDTDLSLIDQRQSLSWDGAWLALPCAALSERAGLLYNGEGRLQAVAQAYSPAREERHWRPELGPFPLAAGGALQPDALPSPVELCSALAQRLEVSARWQERMAFYRDFLLRAEPQPGDDGVFLPEELRARFRLHSAPPPRATDQGWSIARFSHYSEEELANGARELHSLAPTSAAWIAPGQHTARQVRLRAADGATRTLPLKELADMTPEVLAIPRAELAYLGLRPGDGIHPEWLD